jgi:hypothetical protein
LLFFRAPRKIPASFFAVQISTLRTGIVLMQIVLMQNADDLLFRISRSLHRPSLLFGADSSNKWRKSSGAGHKLIERPWKIIFIGMRRWAHEF